MHVQHRIEQHPECAERLPAPFGTETQQHDVAGIERHINRGGFALQILLSDQVSRRLTDASSIDARRKNSSVRRPADAFVTGNLNC